MFLIPLNQIESVDLVIHRKVCTKQCLSVAEGIAQMVATKTLPNMDMLQGTTSEEIQDGPEDPDSGGSGPHLRIVK
jgi:hypothetical protein